MNKPFLAVVFGLMGSGKSKRASTLARVVGAAYISSDITRKRMANVALTERAEKSFGQGIYSREFTERVYSEMLNMARKRLSSGKPVVMDATYSKRRHRDQARALAMELGTPFFLFFVDTPEKVIRERLLRRERKRVVSDGRIDVFPKHREEFEFPDEDEKAAFVPGEGGVDGAVKEMVAIIEDALGQPRRSNHQ